MQDVGEMVPVAQEAVRQDLRAMFRGAIRVGIALQDCTGAQRPVRAGTSNGGSAPTVSGRPSALAAPCTTLHVSVLPVADGWPRRRSRRPVGRPPDDETR